MAGPIGKKVLIWLAKYVALTFDHLHGLNLD